MLDYWGLALKQASDGLRDELDERQESPPQGRKWKVAVCGPQRPAQVALGTDFTIGWDSNAADFAMTLGEFYCKGLTAPVMVEIKRDDVCSPAFTTSAAAVFRACWRSRAVSAIGDGFAVAYSPTPLHFNQTPPNSGRRFVLRRPRFRSTSASTRARSRPGPASQEHRSRGVVRPDAVRKPTATKIDRARANRRSGRPAGASAFPRSEMTSVARVVANPRRRAQSAATPRLPRWTLTSAKSQPNQIADDAANIGPAIPFGVNHNASTNTPMKAPSPVGRQADTLGPNAGVASDDGNHARKGPGEDVVDDGHDENTDQALVGPHQSEPLGDPRHHCTGACGARNARAKGRNRPERRAIHHDAQDKSALDPCSGQQESA
jgi:hypothetical protein